MFEALGWKMWATLLLSACILTACGGSSRNETEGITRGAPDLTLNSLAVSGGELSPNFDPTITLPKSSASPNSASGYLLEVASDIDTVNLVPVASQSNDVTITVFEVDFVQAQDDPDRIDFSKEIGLKTVASGDSYTTPPLDDGDNYFVIRVALKDDTLANEYRINVYKANNSAALGGVRISPAGNSTTIFSIDPSFQSDVFDYRFNVDSNGAQQNINYANCAVDVTAGVFSPRASSAKINGEAVSHGSSRRVELSVGSNVIDVEVTAEDGVTTQPYTLSINRAAPTEAELNQDTTLSSLTVRRVMQGETEASGVPFSSDFSCLSLVYTAQISKSDSAIEIVPVASNSNATVAIGKLIDADDNGIYDTEIINNETRFVTEPYVAGDENFVEGSITGVLIAVTSADGSRVREYQLLVERLATERIRVDNAAALQNALQNAQPNQEIYLEPVDYLGSLTTSGLGGAHFYSAQSGTAEEPIVITGNFANLKGSDAAANIVLHLAGDYWQVDALLVSDANEGIVLDAASNNTFSRVLVSDVTGPGFHLRGGSQANLIEGSVVTRAGKGIVIGSDDSLWANLNPMPGPFDEKDHNNRLRRSTIGPQVSDSLIEVKEGTLNNTIEFSSLDSRDFVGGAPVMLGGNDIVMRYNTFYHQGGAAPEQIISLSEASEPWHNINWGEGAKIYQNVFSLGNLAVPLVGANAALAVDVADNTRDDGGEVVYSGAGIDQAFSSPLYQIQWAQDIQKCLGVDGNAVVVDSALVLADCSSQDAMSWQFDNAKDGFVKLRNSAAPTLTIGPDIFSFQTPIDRNLEDEETVLEYADVDILDENAGQLQGGFIYQWLINFVDDDSQVRLLNRSDQSFGITVVDDAAVVGTKVKLFPLVLGDRHNFILKEQ